MKIKEKIAREIEASLDVFKNAYISETFLEDLLGEDYAESLLGHGYVVVDIDNSGQFTNVLLAEIEVQEF